MHVLDIVFHGVMSPGDIFKKLRDNIAWLARQNSEGVRESDGAMVELLRWLRQRPSQVSAIPTLSFLVYVYQTIVPFSRVSATVFGQTKIALVEWAMAMWDWRQPTTAVNQELFWFFLTVGLHPEEPAKEIRKHAGKGAEKYCLASSPQHDALVKAFRARLNDVREDDQDDAAAIVAWARLFRQVACACGEEHLTKMRSIMLHAHARAKGWASVTGS